VGREEYRMPTGTQGGRKKGSKKRSGGRLTWTPQGLEGVGLGPSILVSELIVLKNEKEIQGRKGKVENWKNMKIHRDK
jgi:hypothetical protein